MLQYTIQRILLAIPTLLGISLLSFLIMHLAPGDPVDLFLGGGAGGAGVAGAGFLGAGGAAVPALSTLCSSVNNPVKSLSYSIRLSDV